MAISTGAGVGFFDLKDGTVSKFKCDSIDEDEVVTSLSYDTEMSNVLYAATTKGNVLILRVHADRSRIRCRALRRIPDDGRRPQRHNKPGNETNATEAANEAEAAGASDAAARDPDPQNLVVTRVRPASPHLRAAGQGGAGRGGAGAGGEGAPVRPGVRPAPAG